MPQPIALTRGESLYNLSRRRALFTRFVEGLVRLLGLSSLERIHLLHRDSIDERTVGIEHVRAAYDRRELGGVSSGLDRGGDGEMKGSRGAIEVSERSQQIRKTIGETSGDVLAFLG